MEALRGDKIGTDLGTDHELELRSVSINRLISLSEQQLLVLACFLRRLSIAFKQQKIWERKKVRETKQKKEKERNPGSNCFKDGIIDIK